MQVSCDVNAKSAVRTPVEVFKTCPDCQSPRLIPVSSDVLCADCDWDSIELYADVQADSGDHINQILRGTL